MRSLGVLAFYAACGIASEALVTAYYRCIDLGLRWPASALSLSITLFGFWVLSRVLRVSPSWRNAAAYAVGNAAGCFLAMSI